MAEEKWYYGEWDGPGPSYFRVVQVWKYENEDDNGADIYCRNIIEINDTGDFLGTYISNNFGHGVGNPVYVTTGRPSPDTGWFYKGRFSWGGTATDYAWAGYTGWSGNWYDSSSRTSYTLQPKRHTYSFDANGGGGAPSSKTKITGVDFVFPNDLPVRSGYLFNGWARTRSSIGGYAHGQKVYGLEDKDMTWYATWLIKSYYLNVSMMLDGEVVSDSGGDCPGTFDVYIEDECVESGKSSYKENYNYGSAYRIGNITSLVGRTYLGISDGSDATSGYIGEDGNNIVLKFVSNNYNITYNSNNGSYVQNTTYTYSSSGVTNISSVIPTRPGYKFLGWSKRVDASEPEYESGAEWNLSIAQDTVLYAVWQPMGWTMYDSNGNKHTSRIFIYDSSGIAHETRIFFYDGTGTRRDIK